MVLSDCSRIGIVLWRARLSRRSAHPASMVAGSADRHGGRRGVDRHRPDGSRHPACARSCRSLAGLFTFVPYFGAIAAAAVPAVFVAFTISWQKALWVIAIFAVAHTVEGYVVAPIVQRNTAHLPPALTILSMTILARFSGRWASSSGRRFAPLARAGAEGLCLGLDSATMYQPSSRLVTENSMRRPPRAFAIR